MKYIFKNKLVPLRQEFNIQLDHINAANKVKLHTENLMSQALLDELPQLIWVKSQQNQYYYNQAMCQYIGKNLNQHDINFWQKFVHPEDFEHFIVLWQHSLLTQQDFEKECRIKHVQKGYRFCLISVQHQHKNLNNFVWMVTVTDIHEHYLKQLQLTQQIIAQSQMLDASLDGINMLTADGLVSYMNRSACLALDVSINEKNGACLG